jgi:hypothetical protein
MRLKELEPQFLKITSEDHWICEGVSLVESDGLLLLCPVCFKTNGGKRGTHCIICWKPHVPLTQSPGPGRWNFIGASLDDVTLQAGSSSVFLTAAPCRAHFFIRNGEIQIC